MLARSGFQLFLFFLVIGCLNWPLLSIAAKGGQLSLFVYLFAAWTGVIVLLFFVGRHLRAQPPESDK